MPNVGDDVRAGGGLAGVVEQVITGGVVYDPLTESTIVAAQNDPVLVVGTKTGLRAAVAASEVTAGAAVRVGADVMWSTGQGVVDMVVTSGEVPGVPEPMTGTKNAPAARVRTADGQRVAVAVAELAVADTPEAEVPAQVLEAVRERGLKSWPGAETTSLSRQAWADARVEAFLAVADGEEPAGYCRDADLLP